MIVSILIEGINPEPWQTPGGSGRSSYTREPFASFKAAIREEVENALPVGFEMFDSGLPLRTEFWFWRQLEVATVGTRQRTGKIADRTNLQKAFEDALQKIIYPNDRQILSGGSLIVSQAIDTPPLILAVIGPHEEDQVERALLLRLFSLRQNNGVAIEVKS